METLVIQVKNKKDSKLIKDLALRLDATIEQQTLAEKRKNLKKSKILTEEEFRAMGGIAKGQLISKEHLRSLSWKKRNW